MSIRSKWSEFEQIFNQSELESETISILKKDYSKRDLKKFENKYGKGLLHMCVELNKPEVAKYLLRIGCKKNKINRQDGRSPLALALSLPEGSQDLVKVLCQEGKSSYSWNLITGSSKNLEFGNETVAEIFRSYFTRYLRRVVIADYDDDDDDDEDDEDDDQYLLKFVPILHKLDWPLENISFLKLEKCTRFAQFFYSVADADAERVKYLLANNNYSPKALLISLSKAVFVKNPKSTVIMKMLTDNGATIPWSFYEKQSDLLDEAFVQNNVDKALILLHNGDNYQVRMEYFVSKTVCGTKNSCFEVFFKPAIAFDSFLELIFPIAISCTDSIDSVIKYHSRIDGYNFPQEIDQIPEISIHCIEYRNELEKMKNTKINEDLTVCDFMDLPLDNIVAYSNNEELMDKLKATKFEESFPLFSDIILKRLEVACQIRDWIDQSKDFLAECLPAIVSNDIVLSKVVCYLGVPNLIVMSF